MRIPSFWQKFPKFSLLSISFYISTKLFQQAHYAPSKPTILSSFEVLFQLQYLKIFFMYVLITAINRIISRMEFPNEFEFDDSFDVHIICLKSCVGKNLPKKEVNFLLVWSKKREILLISAQDWLPKFANATPAKPNSRIDLRPPIILKYYSIRFFPYLQNKYFSLAVVDFQQDYSDFAQAEEVLTNSFHMKIHKRSHTIPFLPFPQKSFHSLT